MNALPEPSSAEQALRAHAAQACALLKALANEDRLLLLCALGDSQKNVGELETLTGIVQPTLSQQLGVLRHEGLVETRKEGKYVYYRGRNGPAMRIMRALWEIYCAPQVSDQTEHV
ncbi:MAG: metalloregulator ArsR/SmtB family transcription factor [Azoarcus sp.]|jgi:DNA-binding transcriptional ArsR family regulator|nr:metalloregulator ArsR/SmtB family transcription factor [Azoarcus sp.]